jgi:anti-anti-sigma factor
MEVTDGRTNGVVVIGIDGPLDRSSVTLLDDCLSAHLAAGERRIVIDLQACSFMDGGGLGLILFLLGDVQDEGALALAAPNQNIMRLLHIAGLIGSKSFEVHGDVTAACASISLSQRPRMAMRVRQFGATSVCLSSNGEGTEGADEARFAKINVPLKVEKREAEDGPLVAQIIFGGEEPQVGTVIEERSGNTWILFRLSLDLLPEGRPVTLSALLDKAVLWRRDYRVAWRGRFPALEAASTGWQSQLR